MSHLIDPTLLRADDFDTFMIERQKALIALIEKAMGKQTAAEEEGEEQDFPDELDEDQEEAEFTVASQ